MEKEVLAVRVPTALKRMLAALAKQERRTLSNFVEVILAEALQARKSKEQAA